MRIAILGTGYVADMYASTFSSHPELKLVGAYDNNAKNLKAFTGRWPTRRYNDFAELLADDQVELVLNLTNPRSHYELTKTCMEAGKHLYSEKPLAMTADDAMRLVTLAKNRGLYLSSAPCSMLGDTAQTLWKAIRDGVIGKVRLVYANFDDGMIAPNRAPWVWKNAAGISWPAKDEFEVGCTYEHAGYILTWLAAFFGPARHVTSFATCQLPDKGVSVENMAPDFSVGCIEYDDNVVARLTCGLVAPQDKSIQIIGDTGTLSVRNVRNDYATVFHRPDRIKTLSARVLNRLPGIRAWSEARFPFTIDHLIGVERLPLTKRPSGVVVASDKPVDFLLGPSEMATAIRQKRPCRLSAQLGLHITELVETLQYPERSDGRKRITSAFDSIQPLPW